MLLQHLVDIVNYAELGEERASGKSMEGHVCARVCKCEGVRVRPR